MRARAAHRAPQQSGHARQSLGVPPAFTLIELLVVISIFVLVLAIGVPAFSSLLYSSDQSLSENALRQGLAGARDAAARSPAGQDAAAVFFYDQHRLSIVVCGWAGVIDDENVNGDIVRREIFAPIPGMAPVQLPRLWMVRGYCPPGRLDGAEWYEDTHTPTLGRPTHWVFPETSFFDLDDGDDGQDRQTFMVRFEGGTGKLRTTDPAAVLVLAPSPSTAFRNTGSWSLPDLQVNRVADPARFVRRLLNSNRPMNEKRDMLGDRASDTVLARPLGQLAIYNERRLAGALGARLNDASGCLYAAGPDPAYVAITGTPPAGVPDKIDEWIEDRVLNGAKSDARIFSIHPHLGWLQELTGSRP